MTPAWSGVPLGICTASSLLADPGGIFPVPAEVQGIDIYLMVVGDQP